MFFVLGFFNVRRCCDDGEEASLKMPSRPTAAIEAGARGLAEHDILIRVKIEHGGRKAKVESSWLGKEVARKT